MTRGPARRVQQKTHTIKLSCSVEALQTLLLL